MKFTVIDTKTGEYPDCETIALKEEWANGLVYCDIDTFAVTEDGTLLLMDDCGNPAYCPPDRFAVEQEALPIETGRHRMNQKGDTYDKYDLESYECPQCKITISQQKFLGEKAVGATAYKPRYCPDCGQRIDWGSQ